MRNKDIPKITLDINLDKLNESQESLNQALMRFLNVFDDFDDKVESDLDNSKAFVEIDDDIEKIINNHQLLMEFIDHEIEKRNSIEDIENDNLIVPIKKKKEEQKEEIVIKESSGIEMIKDEKEEENNISEKKISWKEIVFNKYLIACLVIGIAIISYFVIKNSKSYVLKLNGSDNITIKVNDTYHDEGCSLYNTKNELVKESVEVINSVDTSKEGEYKVICLYGNLRVERKVIVKNNP